MTTNLSRHRADLDKLLKLSSRMFLNLLYRELATREKLSKEQQETADKVKGAFEDDYQKWYTEALSLIRQLTPDRVAEFEHLYKGDGKRREINASSYCIQDWLNGIRSPTHAFPERKMFDDFAITSMRFKTQKEILEATAQRFESTLFDIRQIVQADLFDSELDEARELVKHGFLRGAGAIAGVVLEKHLAQVAQNHSVQVRKQHPTISDLNDALKNAGVVDVPGWRGIQRLGDLRNLCDHNKNREPNAAELAELIGGGPGFRDNLAAWLR
jgi:hypothetical protein